MAQDQNAWSSSRVRSRRRLAAGSSAHPFVLVAWRVTERTRVCPAAENACPGGVARAARSSTCASLRRWLTDRTSTGRTGRRSRVRASMRDLRCRAALRWLISAGLTGHRATHGPRRAGSSAAHCAMSR